MEYVLEDARMLAASGVTELNIVAQETTTWGKDIYGEKRLHELLRALCRIEGIRWIRLLYCYPEEITDELIEVIRTEPKFCHYLDMPIQHSSDRILKRMGRRTSRKELEEVIGKLRREIPDIALRTTLISGFPGEGIYVGRTYRDAPDVDGYVFLDAEEEIISGDFVTAKITGADEYDLTGEVLYEFTE